MEVRGAGGLFCGGEEKGLGRTCIPRHTTVSQSGKVSPLRANVVASTTFTSSGAAGAIARSWLSTEEAVGRRRGRGR